MKARSEHLAASFDRSSQPETLKKFKRDLSRKLQDTVILPLARTQDYSMAVTQEVRNKVVVRKLPPGISREEVQAAIDVVCQGKYDWYTFVPGKVRCAGCGNSHS